MNIPIEVKKDNIIFFDGVCNLCNRTVQFIIRRDKNSVFSFAPLQSEFAKNTIASFDSKNFDYNSVVYLKGQVYYDRSDAILKILGTIGGIWKIFTILRVIPKNWRDRLYDFIAGKRYTWFGRRDTCMVPTPELQDRFIT